MFVIRPAEKSHCCINKLGVAPVNSPSWIHLDDYDPFVIPVTKLAAVVVWDPGDLLDTLAAGFAMAFGHAGGAC